MIFMNFNFKYIFLGLFCLLLISSVFCVKSEGTIRLLAVTTDGKGTDANLHIKIVEGNGKIWSGLSSLVGTSTQSTEKTAIDLLEQYDYNIKKYDFMFDIQSQASVVDGPSAGLPTALLLINMMKNKIVPNYVSGTGTISTGGQIGKVGGIYEKTKYAAETGIKIFFVPKSELEVVINEDNNVKKVNLSQYAYEKYNIKVVGVETIKEVLEYDLSNVENIKIAKVDSYETLIYNPPITNYEKDLNQFKNYINEYYEETEQNYKYIENAITQTNIKDNDLLTEMYSLYTDAGKYMDAGKSANEKNYLYSAANNFFIANISLNLIRDILDHDDILKSSTKIDSLTKDLKSKYIFDFDGVPCKDYEWYIGSQERYLWAQDNITKILTTPGNDLSTNLTKLQNYEEAKEWLKISLVFKSYVKNNDCYIDENKYYSSAVQMLDELKKGETIIQKYELYESLKWINGSKNANNLNWQLTSIFEGAIGLAILNTYLELKDENLNTIKESTTTLLNNVDDDDSIWSNLYLQHANYLFNEAQFLEKNNELENAKTSYKSSYQLALFAKNISQVVKDIEKNKSSTMYKSYSKNTKGLINITNSNLYQRLIILFLIIIIILFVIIFVVHKKYKSTRNDLDKYSDYIDVRINKLKNMIIQINKDYKNDSIEEAVYKDFTKKCNDELSFLFDEKKQVKSKNIELRGLNKLYSNKQKQLEYIKKEYNKNNISHKEYMKNITSLDNEILNLRKEINSGLLSMSDYILENSSKFKYSFKKPKIKYKL